METIDEIPGEERGDDQPVYSNPTFQGCEFCWFFLIFICLCCLFDRI